MGFKRCYQCQGQSSTSVVVETFIHGRCGHLRCDTCHITFDSNVDEIEEIRGSDEIVKIEDETTYRLQFGEASKIRTEGVDYAQFDWSDQSELQAGVARPVFEAIDRWGDLRDNGLILDVGAGSGFTSILLAERYSGAKVIAIDPSPQVVGADGQRPNLTATQGTLTTVSVDPGSVDVVVILGNLMLHLDPFESVDRALAALKPGGLLVFDFKNIEATARQISILAARTGLARFLPRRLFERNFRNMRFGFTFDFLDGYLKERGDCVIRHVEPKAPRLLSFDNASEYQSGVSGALWRVLDWVDARRGLQAWTQVEVVAAPRVTSDHE